MRTLSFLVVGLLSSCTYAWPPPEPLKAGQIPTEKNITIDPALLRDRNGTLFLYGSGATVWTSKSLYGPWKVEPDRPIANVGTGAPQLYEIDNTYYFIFHHEFDYSSIGVTNPDAANRNHRSSVNVATSDSMKPGSWKIHGRYNVTWSEDYNILDGNLLNIGLDEGSKERKSFLTFGSYFKGIWQLPLTWPPFELAENAMSNMAHLAQNKTARLDPKEPKDPIEGSFQYVYKGWYYLFFSSGACCHKKPWPPAGEQYKIMVCRSKNPSGGYKDKTGKDCTESGGTQILGANKVASATGGQGVMYDDEVKSHIVYYHYVPTLPDGTPGEGHSFGWNKLRFDDDGWPVVLDPSS